MESSVSLLIFIIFLCIVTSAFFSSSETALFSLNKYKLKTAVDNNVRGASSAKWLLDQPEGLISTILICNNVVNIVASSLATLVGQEISGDLGIAIATGILTFVLLMFAEIIPKTIASKFPETVAYNFSPILKVVFKLSKGIVWVFNIFTKLFFRLVKIQMTGGASALSSDELRVIVKESQNLVGKDHSDMLNSILDLEELTVEDVMIPRHEVIGIDIDDDIKTIIRRLNHSPVSRVVVYRESFDEQIIGSLRIKEFYRLMLETGEETKETLMRAIDEPNFIPESIDLTRQLYSFKKKKRKFALVADEYGSFVGIITIDDILEEIVGNFTINSIVDEEEDIALVSSGKYVIDGQANIRDLNRKFGWKLNDEEARTINGFLLEHYQEIPKVGSTFQTGNLIFKVLDANQLRVIDVEIIDTKRYKGPLNNGSEETTTTLVDADGHLSPDKKKDGKEGSDAKLLDRLGDKHPLSKRAINHAKRIFLAFKRRSNKGIRAADISKEEKASPKNSQDSSEKTAKAASLFQLNQEAEKSQGKEGKVEEKAQVEAQTNTQVEAQTETAQADKKAQNAKSASQVTAQAQANSSSINKVDSKVDSKARTESSKTSKKEASASLFQLNQESENTQSKEGKVEEKAQLPSQSNNTSTKEANVASNVQASNSSANLAQTSSQADRKASAAFTKVPSSAQASNASLKEGNNAYAKEELARQVGEDSASTSISTPSQTADANLASTVNNLGGTEESISEQVEEESLSSSPVFTESEAELFEQAHARKNKIVIAEVKSPVEALSKTSVKKKKVRNHKSKV